MELVNHLLCALPLPARREIARLGTRVELKRGHILHEQGEPQLHGYFVEAGLVSLSRLNSDGAGLEAGLVGREGFVGSSAGASPAFTRAKVEISGCAIRLSTPALHNLLVSESALRDVLGRYHRFQLEEAQLNATCNASHDVDQRLAKCLLRSHDRVDDPRLSLTQAALAEMLGVQRTTVNAAIGALARAGAVARGRGFIAVVDRDALKAISCECYEHAVERLPQLGFPELSDESVCAA